MARDPDSTGAGAALDEVLADYLRRVDAGEEVDRETLLATHPQHADELRQYFSHTAAVAEAAEGATVGFAREATPGRTLGIRCPHCHAPMEVAVDAPLTDLTCSACGSHFSLVNQDKTTRAAAPLTTLGRFELVERLGMGGFGTVWKARDKELDRTVAIKIPRRSGMTAEEEEKFFREARAAAQLRHPSIVSVHEVGRDGDSIYIVSDFVRGVNLDDWLTGQRLTSLEAAELCAKIADALEHAHEQGVVHRDLKPANIIMDGQGQPHLMDFGLARRDMGELTVTIDGQVLGTPAYMSPEQARGEAHTADRRSDVYSLGVILFQLLTGELPFRGNAPKLIHQVINDEPPSPRKLNGNVPKDLETITLKSLEKQPTRRYPSAREFAEELRRFLSGEPILARPVNQLEYSWRWTRRHPVHSTAAIALLVGTIACLLAYTFLLATQKARHDFREADNSLKAAKRDLAQALIAEQKAQEQTALAEELRQEAEQQRIIAVEDRQIAEESRKEAAQQRAIAEEARAEAMLMAAENAKQAVVSAAEADAAKHRELEARIDSLLADESYSATDLGMLQANVQVAEEHLRQIHALYAAGRRGGEPEIYLLAKFSCSSAKARLAWAHGELQLCSRHYDDAVLAAEELVKAVTAAYENDRVTILQVSDAQARLVESELCASKVKRQLTLNSKDKKTSAVVPSQLQIE